MLIQHFLSVFLVQPTNYHYDLSELDGVYCVTILQMSCWGITTNKNIKEIVHPKMNNSFEPVLFSELD